MKQTLGILLLTIVSIAIVEGYLINGLPIPILFGLFYNILINGLTFLLSAFKAFKLPDSYYRIKRLEQKGKLYKIFGVDYVRRLLKLSGTVIFDGNRSSLDQLEDQMLFAEKNHTISFSLNFFTMAYLATRGLWELIPGILFFNLLLNFYPMIIQRYNRARIQLIKARSISTQ